MEDNNIDTDERLFTDEELKDTLISTIGNYALEFMTVKVLRDKYNQSKNNKVLDIVQYKEYRDALNLLCSDLERSEFVFEFEKDLKTIWSEDDILNCEIYFIDYLLHSYDECDKVIYNDPELTKKVNFFNSERFEYLSTDKQIEEVRKFLEIYTPKHLSEISKFLSEYDGINKECLEIIEKLSDLGFFNIYSGGDAYSGDENKPSNTVFQK